MQHIDMRSRRFGDLLALASRKIQFPRQKLFLRNGTREMPPPRWGVWALWIHLPRGPLSKRGPNRKPNLDTGMGLDRAVICPTAAQPLPLVFGPPLHRATRDHLPLAVEESDPDAIRWDRAARFHYTFTGEISNPDVACV